MRSVTLESWSTVCEEPVRTSALLWILFVTGSSGTLCAVLFGALLRCHGLDDIHTRSALAATIFLMLTSLALNVSIRLILAHVAVMRGLEWEPLTHLDVWATVAALVVAPFVTMAATRDSGWLTNVGVAATIAILCAAGPSLTVYTLNKRLWWIANNLESAETPLRRHVATKSPVIDVVQAAPAA